MLGLEKKRYHPTIIHFLVLPSVLKDCLRVCTGVQSPLKLSRLSFNADVDGEGSYSSCESSSCDGGDSCNVDIALGRGRRHGLFGV